MKDKYGRKIKRGCFVDYEGSTFKVLWVWFRWIKLTNGRRFHILRTASKRRYHIKNLELLNVNSRIKAVRQPASC